jgi:sporulation protein YlmC with PRC-barrel domain
MIRASDLLGCELRTESGERLGHVHDLRAERADHDWRLTGLVLGRRGISARLVGIGPDALIDGEVIGWEAVSRLEVGSIIVRDTSVARGNFARHGKAASITPWRR